MRKVSSDYNLAVIHPEIAGQWHPTRNGSITPRAAAPSSTKKFFWFCPKGHGWQDTVSNRVHFRTGCPYCSGQRVSENNCLEHVAPHIAKDWHPTKNKELTPKDVTSCSGKKVWRLCDKGHEWQNLVSERRKGRGCPYCSERRVSKDNNLRFKNPTLAQQWHPHRNGKLTPRQVTSCSDKKVWWICSKGHEWIATVANRSNGSGCPYCAGQKTCADNCLETLAPDIASEWHPSKNGDLTPRDVTCGSNKKVWWLCANGHEWRCTVNHRTDGTGCPGCDLERRRSRRLSVKDDVAKPKRVRKRDSI